MRYGGRDTANVVRVLAVVLPLLALVALASAAGIPWRSENGAPSGEPRGGDTTVVAAVIVAGTTIAAGILIVRSRRRRRRDAGEAEVEEVDEELAPRRLLDRLLTSALAYLLLAAIVVATYFVIREVVDAVPERAPSRNPTTADEPEPTRTRGPRTDLTGLLVGAVLVIALVAALTALWAPVRRVRVARQSLAVAEANDVRPSLPAVIDEAVDDLRAEPDPRRAVIAAYARMERGLARDGVPRRRSDAPLEYMERVLLASRADEVHVRRLTDLFARAKFSPEDVAPAARAAAIESLLAIRADLRERR